MNVGPTVAPESIHVHNARHEAFIASRSLRHMEPLLTIFLKIINREIPADIVYEDDCCLAFRDVNPQAPVHVLLIPKKPVVSLRELTPQDADLCAHLLLTVPKVADLLGLDGGYRTVVNTGDDGGQSVFHLHIHILGGRQLTWPPG
ncbi:MAG: histidine triad nucleotide-binding protein [Planctomycetaceae bacterium]